jgi:hypothetical protein
MTPFVIDLESEGINTMEIVKLSVTCWDSVSSRTNTTAIEVENRNLTSRGSAEYVNLMLQRKHENNDDLTQEGSEWQVVKYSGSITSGCAFLSGDGNHESCLIWQRASQGS